MESTSAAARKPAQPNARRLVGIEALRGVAATAVVLFHASGHVGKAMPAPGLVKTFTAGHAGVDLFFVISGFIILFVHWKDVGAPVRLPHYARRRASRILPLYWMALACALAMTALAGRQLPSVTSIIWNAALPPTREPPLLGVAWTLQCEAMFYVAFAVLIWNRRFGTALMTTWAALALARSVIPTLGLPPQVFGSYVLQFFMGMAAAVAVQRRWLTRPLLVAMLGGVLFAAAAASETAGLMNGYGPAARFAYGVPAALVVAGLASAEKRLRVPRFLVELGGASYATYLFHIMIIGTVWQALRGAGLEGRLSALALFVVLAGTALLGGIAIHRCVERPLLRITRARAGSRAQPSAAGHPSSAVP